MAKKIADKVSLDTIGKEELTVAERLQVLHNRLKAGGHGGLDIVLGVHKVTVSKWVNGHQLPRAEVGQILEFGQPLLSPEDFEEVVQKSAGKKKDLPKLMPQIPKKPGRPKVSKEDPEDDFWG